MRTTKYNLAIDGLWDAMFDSLGISCTPHTSLSTKSSQKSASFSPAIDIYEDEKAFNFKVELPGVNIDEVKINVDKGILSISGERKFEKKENKDNYRRIECSYGFFSRSFELPDNVSVDGIDARYKDGILTIMLPKTEETPTAKRIEIRT